MINYKIVMEYDGTNYNGWQRQGNTKNTIQGAIERAIKLSTGEVVEIHGSGRTDAGVHAMGQVANFKLDRAMNIEKLKELLNRNLSDDICIKSIEEVDERFHSRLNAKGKKYLYKIQNSVETDVFNRAFKLHYDAYLDIEKMKKATEYLVGEHDFKSFCSNKRMKKSTVRNIFSIDINRDEKGEISILYHANGFLYNMVRIITGTLIEVGRGDINPEDVVDILEAKDRQVAGFTAAAHGLVLVEVEY